METSPQKCAFSLIELLVVVAIVAILAALVIPAMSSLGRSNSLSGAVQMVSGALDLAHQSAMAQNRPVEVRFYKLPEDGKPASAPSDYRALQLFLIDDVSTNALTKPQKLSVPAIISENVAASSLMDDGVFPEQDAPAGAPVPPAGQNYRYRSFRFKPDGSADFGGGTNCFFTLVNKNDAVAANGLPANYATITVEPLTGRARVVRP